MLHRAGGGALFTWPGAIARAREAPWRVLAAGTFAAGVAARLRAIGRVRAESLMGGAWAASPWM